MFFLQEKCVSSCQFSPYTTMFPCPYFHHVVKTTFKFGVKVVVPWPVHVRKHQCLQTVYCPQQYNYRRPHCRCAVGVLLMSWCQVTLKIFRCWSGNNTIELLCQLTVLHHHWYGKRVLICWCDKDIRIMQRIRSWLSHHYALLVLLPYSCTCASA